MSLLKIEEIIHDILIQKGMTLCTAESCTGGSIAGRLTRVPGASQFFAGGFIPYSNALKMKILKVPKQMLDDYGAVSAEVVSQMAAEALLLAETDWSLAVSGIAGPEGGTLEKPVGTIWAAIVHRNSKPYIWHMHVLGNRETIIEKTVNLTLEKLYELVKSC